MLSLNEEVGEAAFAILVAIIPALTLLLVWYLDKERVLDDDDLP